MFQHGDECLDFFLEFQDFVLTLGFHGKGYPEGQILSEPLVHRHDRIDTVEHRKVKEHQHCSDHHHQRYQHGSNGPVSVFLELLSIVRETGLSALIATHNFELADKMDRKVKLQDGRLIDLRAQVFAPGENFY